jgi:gliding motility-associated-like protein
MGNLSGTGVTTVPNGQAEGYYALVDPSNGQILGQTYLEPQFCTSYGFLAAQNPAGAYAAVGDSSAVLLSLGLGTMCQMPGPYTGPLAPTPGLWQSPNSTQILAWIKAEGDSIYRTQYVGNGQLNRRISPTALQVDNCGTTYFSGWFGNLNGGLITNLYTTPNAYQPTTDGKDFYFLALDRHGNPEYASYFGGNGADEHVDGGTSRFDPNGVIHQAICAGCGGTDNLPIFPPNAHSSTNNSFNCNMAGVQIAFELLAAAAQVDLSIDTICAGDSLYLTGTTIRTDILTVNWGDGSTWSGPPIPLPGHSYALPGPYVLTVTAFDTICNTQASETLNLWVLPGSAVSADAALVFDPCDPDRNLVLNPGPSLSAEVLVLYSSTGSVDTLVPPYTLSINSILNTYSAWLVAYDNVCGQRDSIQLLAEFRPSLIAPIASVTAPSCLDGQPVRGIGQRGNSDLSYWKIPGGGVIQGPNVQWPATQIGNLSAWFVVVDTVCGTKDSVQVSYQILGADIDSVLVPNVFTPNGDGVNDHFALHGNDAAGLSQLIVVIYNRWGQEVYRTNDPMFEWDGRFQGRLLAPGVYLYHLTWQSVCGSAGDQHGFITLNK